MGILGGFAVLTTASFGTWEYDRGGSLLASLTMVTVGAGVGALVDAAIKGKTVVYGAKSLDLTASPMLMKRGAGARQAVRF
jgi:hypothetical protein